MASKRKREKKAADQLKRRFWMHRQKERPCADCGQSYPHYVMDFDHRYGVTKVMKVSQIYKRSMKTLKAEIAKCDVVCANCHRERTHQRKIFE